MKLPSKGSRPPSPSDFLDKLMGRTSGYDARIRPNFKGNRHTVLGGARWDEHLLSGQVWEWAPCSFCVTLLGSEVAQITHRWVSRERCCWLWCFHTEERFSLCHVLSLFLCWPTASGSDFFFFCTDLRNVQLPSYVTPQAYFQPISISRCKWSRQILSDTLPPHSQGSHFIYISSLLHILVSACWVNPAWLSIYTLM